MNIVTINVFVKIKRQLTYKKNAYKLQNYNKINLATLRRRV